jgi:hypothetical protein
MLTNHVLELININSTIDTLTSHWYYVMRALYIIIFFISYSTFDCCFLGFDRDCFLAFDRDCFLAFDRDRFGFLDRMLRGYFFLAWE